MTETVTILSSDDEEPVNTSIVGTGDEMSNSAQDAERTACASPSPAQQQSRRFKMEDSVSTNKNVIR